MFFSVKIHLSNALKVCIMSVYSSGGFRNCRTGGGGRGPGAVEFLRSGDCFDAPSHIPYALLVKVENKINIENIAYR